MNKRELLSIIDSELQDAFGSHAEYADAEIKDQRTLALDYYFGKPFGNEVPGRSKVVSRDVMETVEWVMPSLMRIFGSTDNFAEFTPRSADDVEAAKQEMDYVNYVYDQDNQGFIKTHNFIKDALLLKTGVQKVWWDSTEEVTTEEYTGLSNDAVLAIFDTEDDISVVEQDTDEETGLIDIKIKREKTGGCARTKVIAPEDFIISKRSECIDEAPIVGEMIRTTRGQLKRDGFNPELVDQIPSNDEQEDDLERVSRYEQEGDNFTSDDKKDDRETIWVMEVYLNVDYDGDGVDELRKVTIGGRTIILDNEEVDDKPYVAITPIIMPHKFHGVSLADLVLDIQLIKSTLLRNILDNIYNLNNGRFVGLNGAFNMDDLLNSKPGGVIREDVPNAVRALVTPPLPNGAFDMLQGMDQMIGSRTGATKFSQGVDADVLQNTTAMAVAQLEQASQSRIEMIARVLAETGMKDLFIKLHATLRKNQRVSRVIRLRQNFIAVDPSKWQDRSDMIITTGLGRGTKEQKLQNLQVIGQIMGQASQAPGIVNPQNIYNLAVSMVRAMGMKNENEFFSDPSQQPPPQPQPDPDTIKAQAVAQKVQMDAQMEKLKADLDKQKMMLEAQIEMQELELKKAKLGLERREVELKEVLGAAKIKMDQAELELEREQGRPVEIG